MNDTSAPVASDMPVRTAAGRDPARLFYTVAAVICLLLTFLGFQQFFLHGRAYPDRPIPTPARTVIVLHGLAMTGWVLLFLVQPLLIVTRKHRVHMMLGKIGAVLAALIVILGWRTAVDATRAAPPEAVIWGLPARQFMAVPFISILAFAVFVALGVYWRKRPHIHRPMMLLATLTALSAAVSRIDFLNRLFYQTVWERLLGPFFLTMLLGLLLILTRWALTRKPDPWLTAGYLALLLLNLLILQIAPTPAWEAVASLLLG